VRGKKKKKIGTVVTGQITAAGSFRGSGANTNVTEGLVSGGGEERTTKVPRHTGCVAGAKQKLNKAETVQKWGRGAERVQASLSPRDLGVSVVATLGSQGEGKNLYTEACLLRGKKRREGNSSEWQGKQD